MAKDKNNNAAFAWLQIGLWIIGGVVGIAGIVSGVGYAHFNQRLIRIDATLHQIHSSLREQGEVLTRLDERTRSLDHRVGVLEGTCGARTIIQSRTHLAEKGLDVRGLVVRANSPIRFILPNGGLSADGYEATQIDIGRVLLGFLLLDCRLWHAPMMPEPQPMR